MPKYMAVHVVVLAGLVLAVTFLVFQSRALTIKVQALEAERDRGASAPSSPSQPRDRGDAALTDDQKPVISEGAASPTRKAQIETLPPGVLAAPDPAPDAALTPAQELAVAQAVDRILKEKYGDLPKFGKPGDLEKTLAKELNLTESQKARIAEILKQKREQLHALFEGQDPMAGPTMKKAMEIERRSEAAIKNELDSAQQAKYDLLKKDGKIPQGVMIQVDAGDGSQKEELEVR